MNRFAYLLLTASMALTSSGCCFLYPQGGCFGHCGYGCGDTYYHDEVNPWPRKDPCDSCGNFVGDCQSCGGGGCDSCSGGCESCDSGGFEGEYYGQMDGGPSEMEMAGDPLGEDWRPNAGIMPEYRRVASGAAYRPGGGNMRSGPTSAGPRFFADDGEDGDLLAGLFPLNKFNRRPHANMPSGSVVYGDPAEMQIARSTPTRSGRSMTRSAPMMTEEAPRMAKAPRPQGRSATRKQPNQAMASRSSRGSSNIGSIVSQGPRPGAVVRERVDGAPSGHVYEAPSDVASEYAGSPGPVYMTEPQWYEGPAREEDRAGLVNHPPTKRPTVASKPKTSKSRVARTPTRAPSSQPVRR